jgi:hypothetical protein
MRDLTTKQAIVYVIAILVTGILLFSAGSCTYSYNLDNRDRKQHRQDQCVDQGFGGVVELSDGRSYVCVGSAQK